MHSLTIGGLERKRSSYFVRDVKSFGNSKNLINKSFKIKNV